MREEGACNVGSVAFRYGAKFVSCMSRMFHLALLSITKMMIMHLKKILLPPPLFAIHSFVIYLNIVIDCNYRIMMEDVDDVINVLIRFY